MCLYIKKKYPKFEQNLRQYKSKTVTVYKIMFIAKGMALESGYDYESIYYNTKWKRGELKEAIITWGEHFTSYYYVETGLHFYQSISFARKYLKHLKDLRRHKYYRARIVECYIPKYTTFVLGEGDLGVAEALVATKIVK